MDGDEMTRIIWAKIKEQVQPSVPGFFFAPILTGIFLSVNFALLGY
jgi:hypothetical protein